MLGLENPIHILVLLLVVAVLFGAKRLPEVGRSLGSGMRGFKDELTTPSTERLEPGAPTTSAPVAQAAAPVVESTQNGSRS